MSQTRRAISHIPRESETYDETVSLIFFPDGKRTVHVSKCGLATLMQVQDGWQRLGSWKMAACVATVSKDGKWIVTNIETNGLHTRKVSALEVSRDSLTVASGSLDGSVIVWSMTTGQRLAGPFNLDQGSNHHGKVSFVGFSRCGSWLAGCVNTPSHDASWSRSTRA
ncbi:hypothetical protein V8E55_008602 [Tylopilus felleus]